MLRSLYVSALLVLLLQYQPIQAEKNSLLKESRYVMGTQLEITLCGSNANRAVLDGAFEIAQELDKKLSIYLPESEISLLNDSTAEAAFKLSSDSFELIQKSLELSAATENAFDIGVGPAIELWKSASSLGVMPGTEAIDTAKARIGPNMFELNVQQKAVRITRPGVRVDTDGIGKGFAVDKIVQYLRDKGVTCGLINFGQSSMFALGAPPGQKSWRLLIQFPGHEPLEEISLKDSALSASDSFGRTFEIAGKRFGRLIDPVTALPSKERAQSVVVARDATSAEALSKYVILRGPFNPKFHYEYLLIQSNGKRLSSSSFPFLLHE